MILSHSVEACIEYIFGKISILGKAIEKFPNFKIDSPVFCEIPEVVFIDEFFRDFGETDTCIFMSIKRSAYIFFMSKVTNLAPRRKGTVLIMILNSSKEPVGVPTLQGYQMRLNSIVMWVLLGYSFCRCTA